VIDETTSQRNKRIAKNTLLLYVRLLITMGVSLYTVRIVLNTLGVEDYGLYNVVGAVVALLSFLPGGMASATQRFFSHALGQNDQDKLNRVFGVNTLIYLGIGAVALVVLKTGGAWFVESHLQVPEDRYDVVVSLFSVVAITFVVTVLKSPFMAIIIAHEDIKLYAYLAIIDSLLKLGAVTLLLHLPGEKILLYGLLLLGVAVIDALVHFLICFGRYDECRISNIRWDASLAKEVVGFTGWTLFGQLTTVARGAGVTILLNQYFSPAIIAARAIAMNIAGQANMLSTQFNTSLYPPIIKAYAAEKKEDMYGLVINGSKGTFYLMWIIALPVYLEMEAILTLWLKTPPDYTVVFARLTLIEALILAVSLPLTTAARAPGKMAAYESILGGMQLSILIASWILLKAEFGPQSVFYAAIVVNAMMFLVRLTIVSRLTGLPPLQFLLGTMPRLIKVVLVSAISSTMVAHYLARGNAPLAVSLIAAISLAVAAIYYLGLPEASRRQVTSFINRKIQTLIKTR
jgi:O-antigen/teichoic acid export membrane protein